MKKHFPNIAIITSLLVFSFGIRVWRVTEAPASVNWDEAALGYNAYSMLKTGRDEFGKLFPVSLRSFNDYKPALYSWFSTIPIAILGLGELSTRMTSIISGALIVFAVLYITAKLSGKFKLGLVAAIFTAVSPWAIHFSRIAFEANLAAAIYFVAIACFIASLKNRGWNLVSTGLFILSMYAYHAQRAIAIPTLIILSLVFKQRFNWRSVGLSVLLLIPLGISFLTEPAGTRLSSTVILKLWPFVPEGYPKVIFMPIYTLIWQLIGQFLAYFSPAAIFVKGSNEPILRIPTLGLLPIELMPVWLAGLVKIFNKNNLNKLLWTVLILAPLPAVITWNWFSVIRTLALYPAFAIVAAIGFRSLKLPRFLRLGYWGVIGLSAWYTILTIGVYAPYVTYGDFQPGYEEAMPYVLSQSDDYQQVVIDTGQATPYIFLLFYGKYSPQMYLSQARRDLDHTAMHGYKFGKFDFRKLQDYELYKNNILIAGETYKLPEYEIENVKKQHNIIYKDFYDLRGYINLRVVNL